MTPEQRRKNRRAGLILAVVVVALFLWTIGKGLKIV
ncbi:MAG: cytochrome oxidase small assembly protein [Desulfobacterium sp.]|nr:cytochrome oxidase small assembly protein [Advenella mandrilli]MDY0222366.1 cytochrome oxidase small assembly protein [Desulfobacterium sp.]